MTNRELTNLIKTLLDDQVAIFHKDELINRAVDEAQLLLIKKAYREGNERLLRPLYRTVSNLNNGDIIEFEDLTATPPVVAERILYPKVLLSYEEIDSDDDTPGIQIDRRRYKQIRYTDTLYFDTNSYRVTDYYYSLYGRMYYTIKPYRDALNNNAQDLRHTLHTNIEDTTRDIKYQFTYIKVPYQFNQTNPTDLSLYPLEIPQEYHPQVAMIAADILNNVDVLENERNSIAEKQQRQGVKIEAI